MAHYVLDVNETLSDLTPIRATLDRHGAPAELGRTWFAGVLRDGFALSLQGRAPAFLDLARQCLVRCLSGTAHLEAPLDEVVEDVLQTLSELQVHPDVVPGIRSLADAGHVITAFSNGSAAATRALLDRAGVLDLLAHVLSVEGTGVWKPHPASYQRAADQLRAEPADLTMVAVHPWDLDGAAAAGLRTAWLDRDDDVWPASFRTPLRRVTALEDLAHG